jgi:hypothetical protein
VKAVKAILVAEGTTAQEMEVGENYEYKSEVYHNLVIEKTRENRLSVEQYYKKRMDRMSAPEVRFNISDEDWVAVEYTNHDTYPQMYEADENGVEGITQLLRTWDKNLQSQFPAEKVVQGGDQ